MKNLNTKEANNMALTEFATCSDCECQTCQLNWRCPKTATIENPCIACEGMPPYAPEIADEENLGDFGCDEKVPTYEVKKVSELFY